MLLVKALVVVGLFAAMFGLILRHRHGHMSASRGYLLTYALTVAANFSLAALAYAYPSNVYNEWLFYPLVIPFAIGSLYFVPSLIRERRERSVG